MVDDLVLLVSLIFSFSLLFWRCRCVFGGATAYWGGAAAYLGGAAAYLWNSENKLSSAEAGTELDNFMVFMFK